jgi:hypothetical protein
MGVVSSAYPGEHRRFASVIRPTQCRLGRRAARGSGANRGPVDRKPALAC